MKNKNIVYILVLLVLILGATFYFFGVSRFFEKQKPVEQIQTKQETKNVVKDIASSTSEMPKFVLGSVSKTEGQAIFMQIGGNERKIIVDDKTTIIKQVKDGVGFKNVPAEFNEIKPPLKIVVFYGENNDLEYKANKIQILDF